MEYYNSALAIETNWLIDEDIISSANYKQLCARNQLRVLRRGCLSTSALVDYESMPERFKRVITTKIGNPYQVVRVNWIEERIRHSADAGDYFDSYKLSDGRNLPKETRKEYYINAIILNSIHEIISSKKGKRSAPAFPLLYWTMDGWDVELAYQKTENGRTSTTIARRWCWCWTPA